MKKALMVLSLGMLIAAIAGAHDGHKHPQTKPAPVAAAKAPVKAPPLKISAQQVQLVGEIVDPQCWFTHDGQGEDHRDCAVMCAKGGQGLALFETKTGRIYSIIARSHGENPNKGLIEHVAIPVRVTGTLFSRGSNHALLVQSVQPVK